MSDFRSASSHYGEYPLGDGDEAEPNMCPLHSVLLPKTRALSRTLCLLWNHIIAPIHFLTNTHQTKPKSAVCVCMCVCVCVCMCVFQGKASGDFYIHLKDKKLRKETANSMTCMAQ